MGASNKNQTNRQETREQAPTLPSGNQRQRGIVQTTHARARRNTEEIQANERAASSSERELPYLACWFLSGRRPL